MYIYGKNVAKEKLNTNSVIHKAFISTNFNDKELINLLNKKNIQIEYREKRDMDKMIDGLHQGIILSVPDYKYASLDDILVDNAFLVILDHLEDPHNFGAIIRSCEAAGVDGIIIPKDRSVDVNSTVIKTSAGAIENVKIVQVTNLVQTMNKLKKEGFWFIGTDMNGTDYTDISYNGKIGIIIGNEGSGISKLVNDTCDFTAKIPMKGNINSLNASVAAGIVIFEAMKQRK